MKAYTIVIILIACLISFTISTIYFRSYDEVGIVISDTMVEDSHGHKWYVGTEQLQEKVKGELVALRIYTNYTPQPEDDTAKIKY